MLHFGLRVEKNTLAKARRKSSHGRGLNFPFVFCTDHTGFPGGNPAQKSSTLFPRYVLHTVLKCFWPSCLQMPQALTEFGELRLDDAGQNEFPTDMLHIVCVLTSTSKHVPAKTPLPETGRRWKQQVRVLLRKGRALHEENGEHYWYTSPEDILTAMQRLHKLPPESVVDLVPCPQSRLEPCRLPKTIRCPQYVGLMATCTLHK